MLIVSPDSSGPTGAAAGDGSVHWEAAAVVWRRVMVRGLYYEAWQGHWTVTMKETEGHWH